VKGEVGRERVRRGGVRDQGLTRMVSRLGGTRSGAPGGYGAFLQNAVGWGGGGPRALLWAGMGCPVGTRGGVGRGANGARDDLLVDGFSLGTGLW
jgi:hypothetical protein